MITTHDQLLAGFDPENNEIDRRILYEVTGMSLVEGEYVDVDTNSDEEWVRQQAPDPARYAFNYNEYSQVLPESGVADALIGSGDEENNEDKGNDGKFPTLGTIN